MCNVRKQVLNKNEPDSVWFGLVQFKFRMNNKQNPQLIVVLQV